MKAIELYRLGAAGGFRVVERPLILPGPSQGSNLVRVKVHYSGVNFADVVMRLGLYPEAPRPPFVPGYEFSGIVEEVASSVLGLKKGDRVLGAMRFGAYCDELWISENQLAKVPQGMSLAEAAAFPVNAMTAWMILKDFARLRAGESVVIPAAMGGVGSLLVQIAKADGARVIALVSTEKKAQMAKDLGADEVILNREWEEGNFSTRKFDVILDAGGGSHFRRAMKRVEVGGKVITYGVSSMISGGQRSWFHVLKELFQTQWLTPIGLMNQTVGVFGLNMLSLMKPSLDPETSDSYRMHPKLEWSLKSSLNFATEKNLKVVLGKTFQYDQIESAHAHLQSRENYGKVLLEWPAAPQG